MPSRILYLGLNPDHCQAKGKIVHWPIIQIIPRPLSDLAVHQAFEHFDQYTHIIITSKSTVPILRNYLSEMGIPLCSWEKKTTLAVGQVTAKHLQECGIIPARIALEETAEGIIQELKEMSLDQAHLFWPHSGRARPIIDNFLMTHRILHTSCILYDPVPQQPGALPDLKSFDEIVFTSPSTVDAFLKFFGSFPHDVKLKPIGPITALYLNLTLRKKGQNEGARDFEESINSKSAAIFY